MGSDGIGVGRDGMHSNCPAEDPLAYPTLKEMEWMVPGEYVDSVIAALFDTAVEPKIVVVGVGGAGGNVITALHEGTLQGVDTVAVNTDPAGLTRASADTKLLLTPAQDREPVEAAAAAAEGADAVLREALSCDIAFIVAGLGGAAGSGAAPVVADLAKSAGAVTVGVAILPLTMEGRDDIARAGLVRFKEAADTVVIVDNNSLIKVADAMPFREAAGLVTKMVQAIIEGVLSHLQRSYYSTLVEEVESVAREVEEELEAPFDVQVVTTPSVEASWDLGPVGFGDDGFLGLR